jgi:branched-chain amino acid aminotransferase
MPLPYLSLNGHILPTTQAHISVQDRGFRYGDGAFETIAMVAGVPYLWEAHYARLLRGLAVLHIAVDTAYLRTHLHELSVKNNVHDGIARILVTRGCGSEGYLPAPTTPPTVLIEVTPSPSRLALQDASPIKVTLSPWRRFPANCLPTDVKIMQGMNATLARMDAAAGGYDEALMLSVAGELCEAASGNLFWLKKETLYTPALSTGCLAGVMRARLIELWQGEVTEVTIPLSEWKTSALIMTNALRGAIPIDSLAAEGRDYLFPKSTAFANHCNSLIAEDLRQTQ